MKISVHSDLHIDDHCDNFFIKNSGVDVIVLAGDVSNDRDQTMKFATMTANHNHHAQVLLVLGNHDHYDNHYDDTIKHCMERAAETHNLHFLEHDSIEIKGVVFMGCTFWSNYQGFGGGDISLDAVYESRKYIPDFFYIEFGKASGIFTPGDCAALNNRARQWLSNELPKHKGKKTVVITHFVPMTQLTSRYTAVTPYFVNNCRDLVERNKPALWIYGHGHENRNEMISSTRFVSNCRGYAGEEGEMGRPYQPDIILEVK